ncbi:hypothetical protein SO802_028960 [Lithocarpus litseifolius]|uniref:CCHC-type domain-containing protein n=1 Tax=Lithocarpus litseifolius TaxID=425828 RepID=A0AAW2BTQ1_9ROSI
MSFAYSLIGIGLSIAKIAERKNGSTSIAGVTVGVDVTRSQKVHGLPTLWRTENNLKKIGSHLEQVLEANIVGDPGGGWKKFLRVRVDIPIEKPLLPGFFLPRPKKSDIWIGLKYEKLADSCYKCGIIGHEERACEGNLFQLCNPKGTSFNAGGPWLQAENDYYPSNAFLCTEVPASASDSTEPPPIHTQAVTSYPVPTVQPRETLASTYCTTPKDDTASTTLHQSWQTHATSTTPKPPGKSTKANVHFQTVADMGLEIAIPQHTKPIESNAHVNPKTTNQALGFRKHFRLTPVQVGLMPIINPLAHGLPSQDITAKTLFGLKKWSLITHHSIFITHHPSLITHHSKISHPNNIITQLPSLNIFTLFVGPISVISTV